MDTHLQPTVITPLDKNEAQLLILTIKQNLSQAADLAVEFDRRLGWKALGYTTLAECFERELHYSMQHGYRLLNFGQVRSNLLENGETAEDLSALKEHWVRDTQLNKLPPHLQTEAYRSAKALAEIEQSSLSLSHLQQTVQMIQDRETVFDSPYHILSHMVRTGLIVPRVGRDMNDKLENMKPVIRGLVIQLLAKYSITCADLLAPLAEMFERRNTDKASTVLPEIERGFLGGIPLQKATLTDLARANREAQLAHISESVEMQRQQALASGKTFAEPVIITVYKGDAKRTAKALREVLCVQDLADLMVYLNSEKAQV